MSRSYKKPFIQNGCNRKNRKWWKQHSNKLVRKHDIESGGSYKKVMCRYEITDQIADCRDMGEYSRVMSRK